MTWSPPDVGTVGLQRYDVRYIRSDAADKADGNWTERLFAWRPGEGDLRYIVGSLDNGVQYDVQVRAVNSVGTGPWSSTMMGTPAVQNHDPAFPATETGARSVDENTPANRNIGTAIAAEDADTDTLAYSVSGSDAAFFELIASSGQLRTRGALNHESRSSYSFTMSVHDGKDTNGNADTTADDTITVTVTVVDVDEPADISFAATGGVTVNNNALSVDENYDGTLATFIASDPERKPGLTYEWSVVGTDLGDFAITAAGVLSFAAISDYERPADSGGNNVYDITVSALDSDGLTGSIALTVTVDPVNELPTITGNATPCIEEEGALFFGTYRAADPEGATIAWQPLNGADRDKFDCNSSNGRLAFKAAPDFEDAERRGDNEYSVTRGGGGGGGGDTTTFDVAVTVTNKEEPGVLALPATQPQAEADHTATLSDRDGVRSTTWTWERSLSRSGPWTAVSGSADSTTTSVYTPVTGDIGYFLRATAAYTDGHGPNRSLVAVSNNRVRPKPVLNNPPAFTEMSPTRSIAENAQANAPVGGRVTVAVAVVAAAAAAVPRAPLPAMWSSNGT